MEEEKVVGRRENKRGALDGNLRKMVTINAEICMRGKVRSPRWGKTEQLKSECLDTYYGSIRNVSE